MIVSRRGAMAGLAGAAGLGGVAGRVTADPGVPLGPAQSRERLLASALGIRGDDTAADTKRAQRAIEMAARQFRALHFDGQHEWVFRTSLTLFGSEDQGSTTLRGEGAYATIIRCSDPGKPVFVNDDSGNDFRRLSIRSLTIRGGSQGLSIRRSGDQVASLFDVSDVRFEYQKDVGISCDQYLISSNFTDTVFYYCNRGIYCGRNVNNVLFVKPRFEGLNGRSVEFASPGGSVNGCEDVRFVSPRFEGRNQDPAVDAFVIGGYRMSTLTVEGGYFEETHRNILQERGGLGQVVFRNCHFTGQASSNGKLQQEIFDSDSIVTFDGNRFVTGTDGSRHMLVAGVNRGLAQTRFGRFTEYGAAIRYVGAAVALNRKVTPLLRISWAGWSSPEDRPSASMTAEVKVAILADDEAGDAQGLLRCDLVVTGTQEGHLHARISSLQPAGAGYAVAVASTENDVLAVVLTTGDIAKDMRRAVADITAIVVSPGDVPFLIE